MQIRQAIIQRDISNNIAYIFKDMANTHHTVYEAIWWKHVFFSFTLWKSKARLLVHPLAQTSYFILIVYKFCCKFYHVVWLDVFLKFYHSGSQNRLFSLHFSSPQVAPWSAPCIRPHHSFTCDSPSWLALTQIYQRPSGNLLSLSLLILFRSPDSFLLFLLPMERCLS